MVHPLPPPSLYKGQINFLQFGNKGGNQIFSGKGRVGLKRGGGGAGWGGRGGTGDGGVRFDMKFL